jgi:hypothetical protein
MVRYQEVLDLTKLKKQKVRLILIKRRNQLPPRLEESTIGGLHQSQDRLSHQIEYKQLRLILICLMLWLKSLRIRDSMLSISTLLVTPLEDSIVLKFNHSLLVKANTVEMKPNLSCLKT